MCDEGGFTLKVQYSNVVVRTTGDEGTMPALQRLSSPLVRESHLGGLAVGSTEVDAYSREEVSFLSLVANQVALAVDDALTTTSQAQSPFEPALQHRSRD
jgi:GAF domain-containing protein